MALLIDVIKLQTFLFKCISAGKTKFHINLEMIYVHGLCTLSQALCAFYVHAMLHGYKL